MLKDGYVVAETATCDPETPRVLTELYRFYQLPLTRGNRHDLGAEINATGGVAAD